MKNFTNVQSIHICNPKQVEMSFNRDFYITRKARDEFQFPGSFYSIRGNIVIPNYQAAQSLATFINQKKSEKNLPKEQFVQPAQLNAMGLLHELYHLVLKAYREKVNHNVFAEYETFLVSQIGSESVKAFYEQLADAFPPLAVYRKEQSLEQFLNGLTDGISNRQVLLEEVILLHLQHRNPALQPMADIIEEQSLFNSERYNRVIELLEQFFDRQPAFTPGEQPLVKMLMSSITSSPNSLTEQLFYVQSHWKFIIDELHMGLPLFRAMDFLTEEGKYFLSLPGATVQNNPAIQAQAEFERAIIPNVERPFYHFFEFPKESPPVPDYKSVEPEFEPEQFTQDLSWMPKLVLIAKNAFVWLDQLSKKYQRSITRLDQIPDEELDRLSSFGITGLWLIGIWRRSRSSKKIKHIHGNLDAVASAYSLDDYVISDELGGDEAYRVLRDRARWRGIRLACDMVPNHFGIDSQWALNHPERFIQTETPPYPNYTFNGPDLSDDSRVGIFIEDGYWRRSDAAVVFKRVDRWTGEVRYLYHGNDGTSTPWNDTAQLDFLKPEVREAVIQTILHVARMFPVIRFDAAMTLAKKHFQRLWYPHPGTAGSVPSRAMFSMTKEQFDAIIPVEFWREVVDRVQQEAPDTLLLAEAFWLMEGYFVRTLGMHRVYNSAFMHMLKKEENADFRQSIKNVLEFNPQILKRHVNFMSNPDEETAVAQFGSHDKYFGVCTMMLTLPGLPMFGHGQIEGFKEKYGMEYQRAYYDEQPDYHLVNRHEREIVPLLKKRYLFAEVEHFQLYDFKDEAGMTNENVFAFSNRYHDEKALIIYNNAYELAKGWIKPEAAEQMINNGLHSGKLDQSLGIFTHPDLFVILKDEITQLEFLYSSQDFLNEGLYIEVGGYKSHVFLRLMEDIASAVKPYDKIVEKLKGHGVPSIEEELSYARLESLHAVLYNLLTEKTLKTLHDGLTQPGKTLEALTKLESVYTEMLTAARIVDPQFDVPENNIERLRNSYKELFSFVKESYRKKGKSSPSDWRELLNRLELGIEKKSFGRWHIPMVLISLHHISQLRASGSDVISDWKLSRFLTRTFIETGRTSHEANDDIKLIELLLLHSQQETKTQSLSDSLRPLLEQPLFQQYIGVNQWEDSLWFSKEQFEELIDWFTISELMKILALKKTDTEKKIKSLPNTEPDLVSRKERLATLLDECTTIKKQAEIAGYKFEEFVVKLNSRIVEKPMNTQNKKEVKKITDKNYKNP